MHDTFSAFYPLGVASPALTSLDLERHGLVWEHAPAVLGHVFGDGEWALVHRDRAVTASLLGDGSDGEAWLALCDVWDRIGVGPHGVVAHAVPAGAARPPAGCAAGSAGGLGTVRDLLTPAYDLARSRFAGRAGRALLAGNAGHADIPLQAPGSGALALLMSMLGQFVGFPAPRGGAGSLSDALVRRLQARGGEVRCDSEVTRIVVEGGRAVAVRVGDQELRAGRAVLADVAAPRLYGGLVAAGDVPPRVRPGHA